MEIGIVVQNTRYLLSLRLYEYNYVKHFGWETPLQKIVFFCGLRMLMCRISAEYMHISILVLELKSGFDN